MSSSASTAAPDSVVADPSALARKVAAIRATGPSKLQAVTHFVLDTFCRVAFLS
jgi:5'-nucleotidase